MNPTQLLAHFEKIADAPDAILRLRRFILDLAVRGKLVPQDSNDEPASELLNRIAKEKARMVTAGDLKSPRPIPTLSQLPFELPDSWCWSQIAEIGILNPRNEALDESDASFVPMPLIAAEYGVPNGHEVRRWIEIKKGYTHFSDGDVGLAKITPCFENGKSTVFRNLTGGIGSGTTELHIVRPIFVNPDYILLFLKSPHFVEAGIPRMTGTAGQKRVPTEYFAHSAFSLPPLAEQKRIVIRVNELMELCDRLDAARAERESRRDRLAASSLARLNTPGPDGPRDDARFALDVMSALTTRPDQIKQLRQTVLNLAVRGRLVPQDPKDEPATALIKRIAAENGRLAKEGKAKRQIPLSEPDLTRAPFALPAGWAWGRFPELGTFGRGKSKHRPRNDAVLFEGGIHLMIQTGDVARSRGLVTTYTGKYNQVGLSQSFKWPKGTLCITIAANIADSGILSFDACFPDSVVGFIPAVVFEDARYFEYFLRTAKANLLEFAPATAQKNINLEILTQVLIPLPPLNEQRRIVAKVAELMTLCDRLEMSLHAGEERRSGLLTAILSEALRPAEERDEAA